MSTVLWSTTTCPGFSVGTISPMITSSDVWTLGRHASTTSTRDTRSDVESAPVAPRSIIASIFDRVRV